MMFLPSSFFIIHIRIQNYIKNKKRGILRIFVELYYSKEHCIIIRTLRLGE